MLYNLRDENLTAHLRKNQKQNAEIIDDEFSQVIVNIESLLNIQHKIASVFFSALIIQEILFRSVLPSQQLLFSAYHKNALSLFAALELTRTGLHGSARANLRQAFEALMLARYCSLTADEKVLEKWAAGKPLSLGREVIRNIVKPNPQPFWTLWEILSNYTHATIYAQQLSV